ncbi:MAG: hypothetical protein GY765_11840 [bacterium]|nr:hypothetical protein [bacterium]
MIGKPDDLSTQLLKSYTRISRDICRVAAVDEDSLKILMQEAGKESLAFPIYLIKGTGEEVLISDRIGLEFRETHSEDVDDILREFPLVYHRSMGGSHILRLTDASLGNPLEVANKIAEHLDVSACAPIVLQQFSPMDRPFL